MANGAWNPMRTTDTELSVATSFFPGISLTTHRPDPEITERSLW
jgi:hypothetical protein